MDVRSSRNVLYSCRYHVVWCPKHRRAVLRDGIDTRLVSVIGAAVEAKDAELVEVGVQADHVRLLVGVDPQFGIHRLVKHIKATSSRVLREEFPSLRSRLPSLWTNSYFVATTGGVPLCTIKRYIESQGR